MASGRRVPEAARVRTQCYLALYLRLVVALTNDERGDDSESTLIMV